MSQEKEKKNHTTDSQQATYHGRSTVPDIWSFLFVTLKKKNYYFFFDQTHFPQ